MQRTDILRLVGNTPLVEIRRLNPHPNVKIMAKIEFMNPGGSIKDRVAVAMIEAAEKSGLLTPGKTIIEATSGNTGVGLAMVAAVKGYKMLLLMPETASEERKRIMRGFGAEIRLTPGRMGTDGAIEEAYRLARTEPDTYVLMDQFNNPASIEAHYNGTGLEIWEQTGGAVTHVVATLGTSGTAMGLAKRLHEYPGVKVVAVEPFAGHKIQGLKNMHESYPPGIYNKKNLDQILHVEDEEAFYMCRRLAREEGLFVGMSSGAAMAGALKLAATIETEYQAGGLAEGKSAYIVVIFPDSGERYLSTPLFAPKAQEGLRLMNLATGGKAVVDAAGPLNIYTIGPSLDEPDDPDAWRRLVLSDVLARHLARSGAQVKVAVGLADLDDRTLSAARAANLSRADYVAGVLARIKARAQSLRLLPETIFEPASASVPQALDICRKLLGKGQAYEKLRSVYFDVRRDKRYGNMHLMDMDKLSVGKTVDLDDYVKDNPLDFTLLKRASLQDLKLGDVIETEWGNVRPSWFVQIAVAGLSALGRVDVLVAGEDHQFPHLENLRVVWSAAGVEPKAWLADRKLAREEGVALDLDALIAQTGNAGGLRLWLLSAAYRKPLSASQQSLSMWARNWHKVQETACGLRLAQGAGGNKGKDIPEDVAQAVFDLKAGLAQALEDDLSLHRYWPRLFTFVKLVNGWLSAGNFPGAAAALCLRQLEAADAVLGILDLSQMPVPGGSLPDAVRALVDEREAARKAKDFAASDALRARLAASGFRVEDTAQGPRVYALASV